MATVFRQPTLNFLPLSDSLSPLTETPTATADLATAAPGAGFVSIIIPIRNAASFLPAAIESVLAQCYTHWELILVDDRSTDQSAAIAQAYARQDAERIRCLATADIFRSGTNAARNWGAAQSRGDYVIFLDADDVLMPDALSRQLALFSAHPQVGVVCGALQYWYSWTDEPSAVPRDFFVSLQLPSERTYAPPYLLRHNLQARGRKPGMGSFMLRRSTLQQLGAFPELAGVLTEDQIIWAKVCLHVPVFITGHCFLKYRQHSTSMCAQAIREGTEFAANTMFLHWLEQHLKAENLTDPMVWKALRSFQRSVRWQRRLVWLKRLYRYLLPLRTRYRLRDWWTARYWG